MPFPAVAAEAALLLTSIQRKNHRSLINDFGLVTTVKGPTEHYTQIERKDLFFMDGKHLRLKKKPIFRPSPTNQTRVVPNVCFS